MSDEPVQLCVWRVGSEDYVVDLARVDEILPMPVMTRVPGRGGPIEGVVRLRGEVLPVVDVRRRLGVTPNTRPRLAPSGKVRVQERLVVCRVGKARVGFVVDAVPTVIKAWVSELKAAPPMLAAQRATHVLGVWGEGWNLKLMLDVKALLEPSPDPRPG